MMHVLRNIVVVHLFPVSIARSGIMLHGLHLTFSAQCWIAVAALFLCLILFFIARWIKHAITKPGKVEPPNASEKNSPTMPQAREQEEEYRKLHAGRWSGMGQKCSPSAGAKIECGVAFSGGGIRAAAYASGAAKGLMQTEVWPQIQYMSSVSGGGYIASAIALGQWQAKNTHADLLHRHWFLVADSNCRLSVCAPCIYSSP
jgi:hypothetical protein